MPDLSRPLGDPAPRDGGHRALSRGLGITRIARLTGLDRTGVEVASAVRPDGHVLQVTNGKGFSFAEAARGAVMEAAELWAAERCQPALEGWSAEALRRSEGEGVLGPAALEPELGDALEGLRLAWCAGRGLLGPDRAWVPFDAVACPPPGAPLRPAFLRWTSSGMGAHPDPAGALLHALLEAVERDQLARALPEGFTEGDVARRLLDPASLAAAAPGAAALAASLAARGLRVHLLDLCPGLRRRGSDGPPPLDLGLPAAAAVLCDAPGGPVPVAAGYACRTTRDGALCAALLEAAQSRATEIHGAREDVVGGDRHAAAPLAWLLAAARPRREAARLPTLRPARPAALARAVLAGLSRAGLDRAVAVDLPAPAGVAVVKVLVPGLLLSELL
ncbi:MAG: YcaO-like family protein [Anaeromyxobacter sp.]